MFLWFTDKNISKFRTENLKNLPQITYSAPVAGTDRTRTQILSTLSIVLYWYLVSIFANLCFSILNFLYKPYTELIQGLPIGKVLTNATKRKIPPYDRWLSGKESACHRRSCRRHGLDPWVGRSPGEGNGNPFQYSGLEIPVEPGML